MLNLFRRKAPVFLGVEVRSNVVRLLELNLTPQGYRVQAYAFEDLPPLTQNDKNLEIGMSLGRALKRSGTRLTHAAVAVGGSALITKVIQISAFHEKELEAHIFLEAKRYIPYPLTEVNLDFQILGPASKNPQFMDVLVAASPRNIIDDLVEILQIAGLSAQVVDIEPQAIERAFCLIQDQLPPSAQVVAIVELGTQGLIFSVLNHGVTIFTHEQIFASQLSVEEQAFDHRQALIKDDQTLIRVKEALVQEIQCSIALFSSSSHLAIDCLVLAGTHAKIRDLAEYVNQACNIATQVANPLLNMSIDAHSKEVQNDAPSLMICCGLALRNFV